MVAIWVQILSSAKAWGGKRLIKPFGLKMRVSAPNGIDRKGFAVNGFGGAKIV